MGTSVAVSAVLLLFITHCKPVWNLQETCPKDCSCRPDTGYSQGLLVDCTAQNLTELPGNISARTTTLLFSRNNLTRLKNSSFASLKVLRRLDLSSNNIYSLEEESFLGLSQLEVLRLDRNCLELSRDTYPPLVFQPLTSLTALYLHNNTNSLTQHLSSLSSLSLSQMSVAQRGQTVHLCSARNNLDETNNQQGMTVPQRGQVVHLGNARNNLDDTISKEKTSFSSEYPDEALSYLSNLTRLDIDGLTNKSFGPGFRELRKLNALTMTGKKGYCKIDTLTNETLVNIPSVVNLTISQCDLKTIEADAFGTLPNLEKLILSYNFQLGLDRLGEALYGLTKTRIHTLVIDRIVPFGVAGQTITAKNLRHFRNLTDLRILTARFNQISSFEVGVLCKGIPPNLETVVLNANWLELASYVNDLHCLTGLKKLVINGYSYSLPPLRVPPLNVEGTKTHHPESLARARDSKTGSVNDGGQFVLPPHLESMTISNVGSRYALCKLDVDPNNSLKFLDVSGNCFPKWSGAISGLANLTALSLAYSQGSEIKPQFFASFPSLKVLDIRGNNLRQAFGNDTKGRLLRNLKNLKVLDLSENDLGDNLNNNSFNDLDDLEEIRLSDNGIGRFNVSLDHMKKLRRLDLSKNVIYFLPTSLRNHLDSLAQAHNVTVNLTYNPIHCTCQNLDFLLWMQDSKVNFGTYEDYFCLHEDESLRRMTDLRAVTTRLQETCSGNAGALFASSALLVSLVTLIGVALAYRFRWKLRYLYYATRLNFQRQRDDDDFDFDAFVSFSSEDDDFVTGELQRCLEERDVMLCIHSRDFTPGQYIGTNVVDCIQRSRRTLVVLTRALLESDWCHYELQMALMEASHTGRPVLVFLLYEHLPGHQIPRQVLYNIQAATYIEFPREEQDTTLFWNRLALALKS